MASELCFSGGACDGHCHVWTDDRPPVHHPGVCASGGGAYDWNGTATRSSTSGVVNQWHYVWVAYGGGGNCGRHVEGDIDFERDPTCADCLHLHRQHAEQHSDRPDPNWRYDAYPDIDG